MKHVDAIRIDEPVYVLPPDARVAATHQLQGCPPALNSAENATYGDSGQHLRLRCVAVTGTEKEYLVVLTERADLLFEANVRWKGGIEQHPDSHERLASA
jgi:hypothetical protein